MTDIKGRESFVKIEPLNKGWSNDKKYYIETDDASTLLVRVADIKEYDRKKAEFDMMKKVDELGIPMSHPVRFGVCDGGKSVYTMLTWRNGEDAELALPRISKSLQYELGVKSGEILKKIHSIPAPIDQEDWSVRFNRKVNNKIERYRACGLTFDGDDKMIEYIEANRRLLEKRPQSYQHGDYHVGNMIIAPDNTISIIDFNRFDFGDPFEEFNRIVWSASVSPYFAVGQLNGYFSAEPPIEFFKLLALYIASNAISSIYWAIPFGQGEISTMMKQSRDILNWFDGMKNPIPSWYLETKI
ncbi:MAG: phosphotransferase family protein [Clostridia bacterium]